MTKKNVVQQLHLLRETNHNLHATSAFYHATSEVSRATKNCHMKQKSCQINNKLVAPQIEVVALLFGFVTSQKFLLRNKSTWCMQQPLVA